MTVHRRADVSPSQPTGAVADLLGVPEPRLADTVRRGHVDPAPTVVAGRRLWRHEQVLKAAAALGALTDAVRRRIDTMFGLADEEGS
jgi:hypothetical protein